MRKAVILLTAALWVTPATAEPEQTKHGGDIFVSGSGTVHGLAAERDVFAGGNAVTLTGRVDEDIHASGFSVNIEAEALGDVYAAGANVTLRAPIGEDLSALGFTLRTSTTAVVAGNARLAGGTVTIDGPVRGALSVAGGEVILNSVIAGDAQITAASIRFGPDAVVTGQLNYTTPKELSVPERVAAPDRVSWKALDRAEMWEEARDNWDRQEYPVLPTFRALLASFFVTLAFFIVLGAIFLAFIPRQVQRLREAALAQPGLTLLSGVIGLSMLLGMVPISALTILGIPFIPFVLLAIVVLWTLGYVLGAYVVAMRFWQSFKPEGEPAIAVRLIVLALGITFASLLNFVPFLGWVVNFTLVLFGIGAITRALFDRLFGSVDAALDVDMKPIGNGR